MATQMKGTVRRSRKIDPNGNIYYDRGVSDIIFDPVRGTSVKDDIDNLRNAMATCLAFIAANPKGMDGESAYELAVKQGFNGTEDQWLASLHGESGEDGLSAYEIAVSHFNYDGTEEEWLRSLVGPKGDPGLSAYDIAVFYGYTGTEEEWSKTNVTDYMSDDDIQDVYNELAKE